MFKSNSLLGATLLVAGCCIGAGMLGLPVLSAQAGFFPSLTLFFLCWLYMVATGVLLLEINLWYPSSVHIVSMTERSLGKVAKNISWLLFLMLFYSLMVAYISASGELFCCALSTDDTQHFPSSVGSIFFSILFAILIYIGTSAVDFFNRFLMSGLIITYLILLVMGLPHIKPKLLTHQNWSASTLVIPALIVSFGFHNLVPSLVSYLDRRPSQVIKAIIFGSAIPLLIYLLWQALILGIVPAANFESSLSDGAIATSALKSVVQLGLVVQIAEAFAFFAIVTSLLSVSLSFVDFLADALQIKKTARGKIILSTLVMLPPCLFSIFYPHLFLTALNYAGGFGAILLFGILPVLMAWKGRYILKINKAELLPGGKAALILVMMCAIVIISIQVLKFI